MHYIRHYFHDSSNPKFKEEFEDKFELSCKKITYGKNTSEFSYVFEISEAHPKFAEIEPLLPSPGAEGYTDIIYFPQYSEQEFQAAKWLTVRSSFSKCIIEETPDFLAQPYKCVARITARGVEILRHSPCFSKKVTLKSPVKWGNRFFASSDMGESRVFCNQMAKNAMEAARLKGVEYETVLRKSTGAEMEGIYYLKTKNTLADGAVVPISDMDTYVCDQCGMHMVGYRNMRGQFGIRKDMIDDAVDFYSTLPLFSPDVRNTASLSGILGSTCLIVSQRFYQLVKEHKMDRALWFEPISLV